LVARFVRDEEVVGSNPASPTTTKKTPTNGRGSFVNRYDSLASAPAGQ
jgi:hypothetical protein